MIIIEVMVNPVKNPFTIGGYVSAKYFCDRVPYCLVECYNVNNFTTNFNV